MNRPIFSWLLKCILHEHTNSRQCFFLFPRQCFFLFPVFGLQVTITQTFFNLLEGSSYRESTVISKKNEKRKKRLNNLSSEPTVPLFLCDRCSSVPLCPQFLCAYCSSVPLCLLFLCASCSSVPTVPLKRGSRELILAITTSTAKKTALENK